MTGKRVFLSHASEDRGSAEKLKATLERHGVTVWYSSTSIYGSQQWHDEIGRALASCRWFVLLGTKAACRKPRARPWWVQRELLYALGARRYEGKILPLLWEEADLSKLSWFLPQIEYVDFRDNYARGCARLLRAWGKKYSKRLDR